MSSFSVRVTVDHHTASRGMGRQICRVMGSWIEIFQQMNSVIVAIHERLINYIFLLGESRNTDLANSLIEFDQLLFARGSLSVNRAPKSGLFSAHSCPP
jgi:hypothetical protein